LELTDDTYPVIKEDFELDLKGDSPLIRFKPSGTLLSANYSLSAVLGLCNGGRNIGEITKILATELNTPYRTIAGDIRQAIRGFANTGLLQLHTGSAPPPFILLSATPAIGAEVDSAIRYRMGRFYDRTQNFHPDLADTSHIGWHLIFNIRNGVLQPSPGDLSSRMKWFAEDLSQLDLPQSDTSILFAASDWSDQHPTIPVHGHARVCGSDATILWPFRGYTSIGSKGFGSSIDQYDCPWKDKTEKAVWRGSPTGVDIKNRSPKQIDQILKHPSTVTDKISGREIPKGNRLQLVYQFVAADFANIGLSSAGNGDEKSRDHLLKLGLIKESLSRGELLTHKYQIVVDGNSFASQLTWTLHSRSLVLMVPPAWETIVAGITAWEHYVPLAPDYSDLAEKIDWCRANDRQCAQISRAATLLMRTYYSTEQERLIQQGILDRCAGNAS